MYLVSEVSHALKMLVSYVCFDFDCLVLQNKAFALCPGMRGTEEIPSECVGRNGVRGIRPYLLQWAAKVMIKEMFNVFQLLYTKYSSKMTDNIEENLCEKAAEVYLSLMNFSYICN